MSLPSPSRSLFDGAFTLYRLSQLHYLPSLPLLSGDALRVHSRRFTDFLKADVLRGVYVGSGEEPGTIIASGALKACQWTAIDSNSKLQGGGEIQDPILESFNGIQVDIQFEKTTHTALLLQSSRSSGFSAATQIHLPLLMARLPSSLREQLFSYLETTFDTRIEPMQLSSWIMGDMLEEYLQAILKAGTDQFESMAKGCQLVLGFGGAIRPHLKSLVVDIRKEDVHGFIQKGKALLSESSPESPSRDTIIRRSQATGWPVKPFVAAMRHYLVEHTSLDILHKDVFLLKASCGGILLTRDGRLRISSPTTGLAAAYDSLPEGRTSAIALANMLDSLLDAAMPCLDMNAIR